MNSVNELFSHRRVWQWMGILGCLLIAAVVVVACSSGTMNTTASGMGTVNVMLSDPATCQAPGGPYSHVYVTITDVQANVSSTSDSGWTDLTPNLSKAPMQVDLLGLANNKCFLATLGDSLQLQAGSYQQIRVLLASNSAASVSGNKCGNANNCLMLTADSSQAPHTLLLSSEAQTGIKIPSGQISGGNFTITGGQTKDLDIDFNTCVSILQQGNGQYRLKPVLHAGEVSLTASSMNGTVVDAATGNPVNGTVTISLEQKDAAGIDRVIMTKSANTDGTWVLCPITVGNTASTYDIVITGTSADKTKIYAPTIITGISIGSTTGTVKLNPPTTALAAVSIATLNGAVNSVNGSNVGIAIDVLASALARVNSTWYTIPLPMTATQTSAELALTTVASTVTVPCNPTTAYCVSYSMQLPSSGAYIGTWAAGGTTLSEPALLATYAVDAIATNSTTGVLNCSTSDLQSTPASALAGVGPFTVTVPIIPFTGCQ